jgi:hypothetical protein
MEIETKEQQKYIKRIADGLNIITWIELESCWEMLSPLFLFSCLFVTILSMGSHSRVPYPHQLVPHYSSHGRHHQGKSTQFNSQFVFLNI